MDKLNAPPRPLNSTYGSIVTTSRTTGLNSYPSQNLLTIMLLMPLLALIRSLPTKANTQTSPYIWNETWPHSKHEISSSTSMNSISSSRRLSLQHRLDTQHLPTNAKHRPWTLSLGTRCLSSLTTSVLPDHLRNLQRGTLDLLKLLLRQVLTRSPSICLAACAPSTRFSMSPCWNLQLLTCSLPESQFWNLWSFLTENGV